MRYTSWLLITRAAIWVLSSCATLEPRAKEGAPTQVNAAERSEGYALTREAPVKWYTHLDSRKAAACFPVG